MIKGYNRVSESSMYEEKGNNTWKLHISTDCCWDG